MNEVFFVGSFSFLILILGFRLLPKNLEHKKSVVFLLFIYHSSFSFLYYYLYNLRSFIDAEVYHRNSIEIKSIFHHDFTTTGIHFVSGITYVLTQSIHATSLLSSNMIFGMFSFLGFILLFRTIEESLGYQKLNYDLLLKHWLWLIPSLHFWTSMVGKDSLIFFGLSIILYSIYDLKKRWPFAVLTLLVVYQIRPYLPILILSAFWTSIFFMEIKRVTKIILILSLLFIIFSLLKIYFVYHTEHLSFTNIFDVFDPSSGFNLTRYDREANTTIQTLDSSIIFRVLNFLFGPFDFQISDSKELLFRLENLILLGLILSTFKKDTIRFIKNAPWQIFFSLFLFAISSIIFSNISFNFGTLSRYKVFSLVPFFLVYIIYSRR